jgi:hypothetical protein
MSWMFQKLSCFCGLTLFRYSEFKWHRKGLIQAPIKVIVITFFFCLTDYKLNKQTGTVLSNVTCEVIMEVTMKNTLIWELTPCDEEEIHYHFRRQHCSADKFLPDLNASHSSRTFFILS